MSSTQHIKFGQQNRLFMQTLRQRVDQYLKEKNISRHANVNMVIKTIFMFSLYFVPYFLVVLGVVTSAPAVFALWVVMGLGMAGIGLSVMHDANHGSYSKNPIVNKLLSFSLNLMGGYYLNWQIQHNTLHHTFTNIGGYDEDIDAPIGILRFSPHTERKKIHRLQFLYAWFFYGMLTMMWVVTKDFKQLRRYRDAGLLKTYKESYSKHLTILIISKVLYYAYMIVIPLVFIQLPWWHTVLGFLAMQFTTGLLLSAIFQSAHVVEETKFPMPDKSGNIENDWAVHQLFTTSNFAPKSRLFSWYVGGLNYQVEHHLFPSVCHVHYRRISEIVKTTAREFNFPYHTKATFAGAIWSHTKMLWRLGRPLAA